MSQENGKSAANGKEGATYSNGYGDHDPDLHSQLRLRISCWGN